MYESRGFTVTNIHAKFPSIKDDMLPSHINITAANEHVGGIKSSVRTTKEVTRCMSHSLPFKCIPRLMLRSMVLGANARLNDIPVVNGVVGTLCPTTILAGRPGPNYNIISRIEFGT